MNNIALLFLMMGSVIGCHSQVDPVRPNSPFGDEWFQGKALVSSYQLEQVRYGQVHPGEAVMIFVTEDFSRKKQVKIDRPDQAGNDGVKILKMNATRSFNTGFYEYHTMISAFTPINVAKNPQTMKLTMSSQDWCGQSFQQYNLDDTDYRVRSFSYFESEGDTDEKIDGEMLEDELWNRIKLGPTLLPSGKIRMIPSALYQRFAHISTEVYEAKASLESDGEKSIQVYPSIPWSRQNIANLV